MNAVSGFIRAMAPYMAAAAIAWAAAKFLALMVSHTRRKEINWYHEAGLLLFAAFIAGLASQTVIPSTVSSPDGRVHETWLIPFRFICYTYEDLFVRHSCYSLLINFTGNVVMFMPFGFFPPLLWRASGRKAIAAGFFASLFIEITQLFLPRSTDIDDLILNTAGAALGFLIYRLLHRRFGGFIDRFSTVK